MESYVISDDIIDRFRTKFDFNLTEYIDDYYFFLQYQYPEVLNFYLGNVERADTSFALLNKLLTTSQSLNNLLREIKDDLSGYEDWVFLDYITDMHEKLLTMSKIYKFVRSSKTKVNFASELKYEYNLSQNETLEQVSRLQLGSNSADNDWIQIARENSLFEIDYDSESGNRIVLSIKLNSESLGITSIVDSVDGEKILGLDLNRKTKFVNDDLEVLSYSQTFIQSVQILINLIKEQIPEFPNLGRTNVVGQNMNVFGFNSTTRELTETIATDDSIVEFNIIDIKNDFANGQIFVKCELRSRLDLIKTNEIITA